MTEPARNTVNDERKHLFTIKGGQIQNIPPTKAALIEHVKRSCLQASYVWVSALEKTADIPCPSGWGGIMRLDPGSLYGHH